MKQNKVLADYYAQCDAMTPEMDALCLLVEEIIDEEVEKRIFTRKDACVFSKMRLFIARCEDAWLAKSARNYVRLADKSQRAHPPRGPSTLDVHHSLQR